MKRFFLIPLLTVLCTVMAWADPVSVGNWEQLTNAAATSDAEITLTADITMPAGTHNLNGAHISCGDYQIKVTVAGEYTIRNAEITFGSGTTGYMYIYKNKATDNVAINLENASITSANTSKGAIYFRTFTCTLNVDNNSTISSTAYSGVQAGATLTINNNGIISGTTGVSAGTAEIINNGSITGTTGAGISCNGTITNNEGATITGAYGVSVTGETTVLNNGAINASSYSFVAAELAAVMNITNNANIDWSIESEKENAQTHEITNNAGNLTVHGRTATKKKFTGSLTIDNVGGGNVAFSVYSGAIECALDLTNVTIDNAVTFSGAIEANNVTINAGTFSGAVAASNLTINAGTFNGQLSGTGITVNGGTFAVAPAAEAEGIIAGECKFPAGPAIGGLTIADGYHAFHSGQVREVSSPGMVVTLKHGGALQTFEFLEDAFAAAQDGDEIALLGDVSTYEKIWIGTAGVDDAARTLTLDLNGHSVTSAEDVEQTFLLMHGALYVKNSVPGQGAIVNSHSSSGKVFFVLGTYQKSCNPRTAAISDLFTYLNIDEGVKLNATGEGGSAIVVNDVRDTKAGNNYLTKYIRVSDGKAGNEGLANGIRIDVKGEICANKYGIQISGNVKYPNPSLFVRAFDDTESTVAESDTVYNTFIHVYPSAIVTVPKNMAAATPIYSSGYGRMLIEGTCKGANGVYMKSGYVVLNNAIVESTWENNAYVVKLLASGIEAGGNAVVIESDAPIVGYAGHAVLIVNGDTKVKTSATGGAALIDAVNVTGNSTIDKVTINGGTFIGDYAIVISEQTATNADAEVVINGVSLVGEAEVANETGVAAVNSILDLTAVHTTVVGNTLIVSAGGGKPIEITNFGTSADPKDDEIVDIAEQEDRPDANWTGTDPGEVSEGTTVALGELQIISGTSENGGQQLTVGENATLQVERLIMNEYATIIVEAGGQLIVDGTQGINAPEESNIILETSETDQATFLFNPEVTSNRHPMATVKLTTKARQTAANDYIYERFTIPTMDGNATTYGAEGLGSVVTYDGGEFKQALYKWNGSDWEFMPSFKAMNPFQGYQLTNNSLNGEVVYTFEGNLVGNTDNDYHFLESGFGFFGNSYSADINIGKLFESFEGSDMQKTIWIYDYITDGFKTITPESYGSVKYGTRKNPQGVITDIRSMQAFLMNKATAGSATVDYASAIWGNPKYGLVGGGSGAPAKRVAAADRDYITIYVANETSEDEVTFIRSNEYSNAFDNGADASKWMNNDINLYVATEEENLAAVATDEIINMTIAFRSGNETEYTLGFDNLSGEEYAIRDILTGAVVNMVEGATYTFTQDANTTIPARFQIVGAYKIPTGMETIEEGNAVQQKVIMNGVLYILRDNKWYNAQGQIVK